jgi:hypothetical protein
MATSLLPYAVKVPLASNVRNGSDAYTCGMC